jgi:hypothetical protein
LPAPSLATPIRRCLYAAIGDLPSSRSLKMDKWLTKMCLGGLHGNYKFE